MICRLEENDGVLFKRFRRGGPEGSMIKLESINPNYKTREAAWGTVRFVYPAVRLKRTLRR